ncbi:MAG: hypothetical protein COZ12_01880 [Deltaproteobacteria bacterium CG_4_10_14_3_um_filter_60_8]|nr:MAG: hypothetical protein AUK28_10790 [Desulfobacterales bacterium CG2_30_60_27]PIP44281.1 MAG: hypothetical protein COX17_02315 [Deltaproteobacteria bacterium CG23_combo_of_CG06-09_8_20_14_all_60_8]PIY23632.1 MAG: hypothetical protein COZ12_01880 [Deltaproteobacteria bacterium CG_4_10_14_3_um_filter_60_8]
MPPRDWRLRIQDILEAIEAVRRYVTGMNFNEFSQDQRTIDAVVRRVTIIGEASVYVPEQVCTSCPEVPWADMRAMRHFVVHEYFGVSEKILWDTVQNDLPGIVEPLQRLLAA